MRAFCNRSFDLIRIRRAAGELRNQKRLAYPPKLVRKSSYPSPALEIAGHASDMGFPYQPEEPDGKPVLRVGTAGFAEGSEFGTMIRSGV